MLEAVIIDGGYFLRRVGEPGERKKDRFFASKLLHMQLTAEYREARASDDWARLDQLDREWSMLQSL